jgi:Fe-S oxidoreductase
MSLPTGDVIGILADNLRLRGSVLPIPIRSVTGWARGLHLPRGGQTVLYTGQMYQLVPYIEAMVRLEERLGDSPLARFAALARRMNRMVNLTALMPPPPAKARAAYDQILVDVVTLLRRANVAFGYLYEDDLYSGALAHDLGLDEIVADHARRVYRHFQKHGVKSIITVDPHTTNMLRSVYAELIPGYDLRVRSYLEVLAESDLAVCVSLLGETAAIHDSCVYARYEHLVDEPRILLQRAGLALKEPAYAGRATWCCGGPVESLYPEKALANATVRVAQLRRAAPVVVTMCPLCLANLQKAADHTVRVRDISGELVRAYAGGSAFKGARN